MLLRKYGQNPTTMMRIGMFGLVAGALSLRLPRHLNVKTDLADGIAGFFYGLAIGCLLLSLWLRRKHPPASGDPGRAT